MDFISQKTIELILKNDNWVIWKIINEKPYFCSKYSIHNRIFIFKIIYLLPR